MSANFATSDNLFNKQAVIFYGSPHLIGATFRLLHQFKQDLVDVTGDDYVFQQFDLFEHPVHPCNACGNCNYGLCHINHTDGFSAMIEALQAADVVILASPVYFGGYPALLKSAIDRMQQFYTNSFHGRSYTFPTRRQGFLLVTAGVPCEITTAAMCNSANMFFNCINADFSGHLFHDSTDENAEAQVDCRALAQVVRKGFL